jgi:hypothetical protein
LGRAFEPGSGEPGVANDAGWPAGAWDDPVHEQPPKGGLSPVTEYDPGTGVRDSAAFRPLSSCCQGSGTLDMSDPTLSVSAIVLSLSTGACWSPPSLCARVAGRGLLVHGVSPTGVPGPSCCCAPLGALLTCERVGPERQSEPSSCYTLWVTVGRHDWPYAGQSAPCGPLPAYKQAWVSQTRSAVAAYGFYSVQCHGHAWLHGKVDLAYAHVYPWRNKTP